MKRPAGYSGSIKVIEIEFPRKIQKKVEFYKNSAIWNAFEITVNKLLLDVFSCLRRQRFASGGKTINGLKAGALQL